jgi:hypothetical protein
MPAYQENGAIHDILTQFPETEVVAGVTMVAKVKLTPLCGQHGWCAVGFVGLVWLVGGVLQQYTAHDRTLRPVSPKGTPTATELQIRLPSGGYRLRGN